MKKRFLSVMTAVLLLIPLFSAMAIEPCEHYPGEVADHELLEINKIPPQEGVEGSADLCCPICGQIVDCVIFPALPPEASHPASTDEENLPVSEPEPREETVIAEEMTEPVPQVAASEPEEPAAVPVQAETPVKSERPEKSENPAKSESPAQSETPAQAESPAQSETSAQPEAAAQSESPAQSETPAQPEAPVQSETPAGEKAAEPETPLQPGDQAGQAGGTEAASSAEGKGETQQTTASEPKKAKDVIANEPPQTGGSAGGGGSVGSAARTGALSNAGRVNTGGEEGTATPDSKPPQTFPARRIKMKPKPGIRAEAPGILIWPLYGTPFQSLYND